MCNVLCVYNKYKQLPVCSGSNIMRFSKLKEQSFTNYHGRRKNIVTYIINFTFMKSYPYDFSVQYSISTYNAVYTADSYCKY
jgi:hypothetical protein